MDNDGAGSWNLPVEIRKPGLIEKILGILILAYVGYSFIQQNKIRGLNKFGRVFGFMGDYISGLYASGGSIYAVYINNKLDKSKYIRGTIIGILFVSNFARIPLLAL